MTAPSFFVKCRCGRNHPARETEILCVYCKGPTWDFHGVCSLCRRFEVLERQAAATLALVESELADVASSEVVECSGGGT